MEHTKLKHLILATLALTLAACAAEVGGDMEPEPEAKEPPAKVKANVIGDQMGEALVEEPDAAMPEPEPMEQEPEPEAMPEPEPMEPEEVEPEPEPTADAGMEPPADAGADPEPEPEPEPEPDPCGRVCTPGMCGTYTDTCGEEYVCNPCNQKGVCEGTEPVCNVDGGPDGSGFSCVYLKYDNEVCSDALDNDCDGEVNNGCGV